MPTFAESKAQRTLDAARPYISDRTLLEYLMQFCPEAQEYVESSVREWSGESEEVFQVAA